MPPATVADRPAGAPSAAATAPMQTAAATPIPTQHAARALRRGRRLRCCVAWPETRCRSLHEGDHGQPGGQRDGRHGDRQHDGRRNVRRGQTVDQCLQQQPFGDERRTGRQRRCGERAEPEGAVVPGIPVRRPPRSSRSRRPVAATTEPADWNSRVLKAAWLTTCNRRCGQRQPGERRGCRWWRTSRRRRRRPAPAPCSRSWSTRAAASGRCRSRPAGSRRSRTTAPSTEDQQPPPRRRHRRADRSRPGRCRRSRGSPWPRTSAPTHCSAPPDVRAATRRAAARCRPWTRSRSRSRRRRSRRPAARATGRRPRNAANEPSVGCAANSSSPIRIATIPRCVMTAYQRPAEATAGRRRCSASTSTQRGQRHQFPAAAAASRRSRRGRHQHHRQHEQRQHRLERAAVQTVPRRNRSRRRRPRRRPRR